MIKKVKAVFEVVYEVDTDWYDEGADAETLVKVDEDSGILLDIIASSGELVQAEFVD